MITQIINIKNKYASESFQKNYPVSYKEESVPGLIIEFRNVYRELFSDLSQLIKNLDQVKLLQNKDSGNIVLLFRSFSDLYSLRNVLVNLPSNIFLPDLLMKIDNYLNFNEKEFLLGNRKIKYNEPLIMGILNVTPDSFSDGGKYFNPEFAVEHAIQLIEDGADIIDVGGESTRPGAEIVSEVDELKRVIPVIQGIKRIKKDSIISIDTTKSKVAEESLNAGAEIINDISGLTFDEKISELAAKHNAGVVIMHIKGDPKTMQVKPTYSDVTAEIYDHLYKQTENAKSAGVKNIFIDPGIGFGKTIENNYELISRINDFKSLGYPILIGISRKSFLGKTLGLDVNDRDAATVVTEAISLMKGVSIIRTHNVKYAKQLKTIFEKLN